MGLDAVKEAFLSLKNNGVEPTVAAMKAMGDTMAAMPGIGYMLGIDVGEILEGRYAMGGAIAQAGIKQHRSSKGGETSYHGYYINSEGQTIPIKLDISDANKTTEQLIKILDDRFGFTMDKHARTMTDLIARWGNDWQTFQMEVMYNHVFAQLENELSDLITQWEAWAKSPDAALHQSDPDPHRENRVRGYPADRAGGRKNSASGSAACTALSSFSPTVFSCRNGQPSSA